jgi:hypothetical protein
MKKIFRRISGDCKFWRYRYVAAQISCFFDKIKYLVAVGRYVAHDGVNLACSN